MHRGALSPHCSARSLAATAPSSRLDFRVGALPFVNDTAFLAIPKAGSSMLSRHVFTPSNSSRPISERRVFTFVREPLQRLLSGYGTLLSRLPSVSESLKPAWTAEVDDVRRFQGFVEYRGRVDTVLPAAATASHSGAVGWLLITCPYCVSTVCCTHGVNRTFCWSAATW